MAWATKCDKCGKHFKWSKDDVDGFAFLSQNSKREYAIDGKGYDLCPDCVQSLENWFSGLEWEDV